uniref:Uncharacterized protein n=1 Tax=Panagrolaimus sp. PS1159 TaxID=55785 RepID=A0AC35F225_9BILA
MISPTFYDKLDLKYRERLLQLEETLKLAEEQEMDNNICLNLFLNFLNQFIMPKELWDKLFDLTEAQFPGHKNTPLYQFYFEKPDIEWMECNKRKLYDYELSELPYDVKKFCYPNKDLQKTFEDYERSYAYSLIPKSIIRTVERMKCLYSKIKAVEENDEEWFKVFMEAHDEEFIEQNIKYRIGQDLTNKNLWKLYIEYLKNTNNEQVKLKFIEQNIEYRIGQDLTNKNLWKLYIGYLKEKDDKQNPLDFEIFDDTYFDKIEYKKTEHEIIQKSPLTCYFNAENASIQRFPFKPNLMHYILKSANAYILHSLFKSCKWFYLKNPVTICYKLRPTYQKMNHLNGIQIKGQSIFIPDCFSLPKLLENIFIATSFTLLGNSFPNILPLIYRCTVKYIKLADQILSAEELELLIGHGNVLELYFLEVKDSSDNYLILENLLKMVPKIKNFTIYGIQCTPESSKIIRDLPFKNKIERFGLTGIKSTVLEPKGFAEFIKKNIWSNGKLEFEFTLSDESADSVKNFKETVNAFIEENWKNEKQKPKFVVHEL